ncbi:MAG: hypothetical protein KDK40_02745 [Chlamydiia bacterium]|nr:hypothetical protein [Chlamydiia bacterium]
MSEEFQNEELPQTALDTSTEDREVQTSAVDALSENDEFPPLPEELSEELKQFFEKSFPLITENINLNIVIDTDAVARCLCVAKGDWVGRGPYKTALEKLRKQLSLPGFRKGKCPEKLLEIKFQNELKDQFQEEFYQAVHHELLEHTDFSLIKIIQAQMPLANTSEGMEFGRFFDEDTPWITMFAAEMRFPLPPHNLEDIEIAEHLFPESSESRLNAFNLYLNRHLVSGNRITEGSIKEGDLCLCKIEAKDQYDWLVCEEFRTVASSEVPFPLADKLVGKTLGESFEVALDEENPRTLEERFLHAFIASVTNRVRITPIATFDLSSVEYNGEPVEADLAEKLYKVYCEYNSHLQLANTFHERYDMPLSKKFTELVSECQLFAFRSYIEEEKLNIFNSKEQGVNAQWFSDLIRGVLTWETLNHIAAEEHPEFLEALKPLEPFCGSDLLFTRKLPGVYGAPISSCIQMRELSSNKEKSLIFHLDRFRDDLDRPSPGFGFNDK